MSACTMCPFIIGVRNMNKTQNENADMSQNKATQWIYKISKYHWLISCTVDVSFDFNTGIFLLSDTIWLSLQYNFHAWLYFII